jgi:hypothetical protein
MAARLSRDRPGRLGAGARPAAKRAGRSAPASCAVWSWPVLALQDRAGPAGWPVPPAQRAPPTAHRAVGRHRNGDAISSVLCYGAAAAVAPLRSGSAIDAHGNTAVGAWHRRRHAPAGGHGRHLVARPAPPTHGAPLAGGGAMPGAHLKPRHEQRDTVWLLVSGTAVAVTGTLLGVQHDLQRQATGVVLLVLGSGVAGWGLVRLLREQQPPDQPTQAALQGPTGLAGLARPARRDRHLGWPGPGRAGRARRGADPLGWPGRRDHGLASRSATALAAWRGWWNRSRRSVVQRRPARHARTRSRGLGQ